MERGVVVGGTLIALSALAAVALYSQSARQVGPFAEANLDMPIRSATDDVPARSADAQHEAAGLYEDKDGLLEYLNRF